MTAAWLRSVLCMLSSSELRGEKEVPRVSPDLSSCAGTRRWAVRYDQASPLVTGPGRWRPSGWVDGWVSGGRSGQSGVRGRSGLSDGEFHWPAMQARSADLLSLTRASGVCTRISAQPSPLSWAREQDLTGWCAAASQQPTTFGPARRRSCVGATAHERGPQGHASYLCLCLPLDASEGECTCFQCDASNAARKAMGAPTTSPHPRILVQSRLVRPLPHPALMCRSSRFSCYGPC